MEVTARVGELLGWAVSLGCRLWWGAWGDVLRGATCPQPCCVSISRWQQPPGAPGQQELEMGFPRLSSCCSAPLSAPSRAGEHFLGCLRGGRGLQGIGRPWNPVPNLPCPCLQDRGGVGTRWESNSDTMECFK